MRGEAFSLALFMAFFSSRSLVEASVSPELKRDGRTSLALLPDGWRNLQEARPRGQRKQKKLASSAFSSSSASSVAPRYKICVISLFIFIFHPVHWTIICSGSFSKAHRSVPVQILRADTNQTNDCMQIRVSVEGRRAKDYI